MRLRLLSPCIFLLLHLSLFVASRPLPATSSENDSNPYTPDPLDDPTAPLPGRNKLHFNKEKNIAAAFYGDDVYPYHALHVELNQQKFPENRKPFDILPAGKQGRNRRDAIGDIPSWKKEWVRDEKLPALFSNPKHHETTTVMHVPQEESCKILSAL